MDEDVPKRKQRTVYVDEIVAITFLDNPYNFKYVVHKDGNKSNNHVDNLVWSPYPELLKGEWKRIPGYPKYIISERGEVRSFRRLSFNLLKPQKTVSGLLRYRVRIDKGKKHMRFAYELLAITFVPNPNNYKYLTHIDGDVKNTHYSNLRWSKLPEDNEDMTEWKCFDKYPKYLFSNKGEVKSYHSPIPKFLKPVSDFHGYKMLTLYNGKKKKRYYLHRIIAILFVPNPYNSPFVDHIDRNKSNFHFSNLRWVTASENAKNRDPSSFSVTSRPIFKCDLDGVILEKYVSAKEASRQTGISYTHIKDYANGNVTITRGFTWKWENDTVNREIYEVKNGEIFKHMQGDFDGYILDFPNYQISNFGTVLSKGYELKINRNCVYPNINLNKKGKTYHYGIHSLVALFFVIGRTTERYIVNHIDEDKENYHFSNLEWCTPAENSFHSRYKNAKAVKQIHPDTGEVIAIFKSQKDACEALKKHSHNSSISAYFAGLTEKAFGFKWERVTDMNDLID